MKNSMLMPRKVCFAAMSDTFCDIITDLEKTADQKDTSVGKVVESFKHRGFGALLLIPALFMLLPSGAIPGASIIGAIFVFLICGQLVAGKKNPWVPEKIRKLEFNGKKFNKGLKKIEPVAHTIDDYTGKRLTALAGTTSRKIAAIFCILLACLIVPLAVVPFGVFLPALALALFALALAADDGLLFLLGYAVALAAFIGGYYWLL